ncbi:MAG: YHS domain-containing protein [Anaerolineales bacterium]|nr:YHS domain-containing protein [Anaerolineales bacterium]
MVKCPVCGMMVDETTAPSTEFDGRRYHFMNETHKQLFEQDPNRYARTRSINPDPWERVENRSGGCCG